jgi:uncharacterized protein YjbI with pentapeptide repeats
MPIVRGYSLLRVGVRGLALSGTQKGRGIFRDADFGEADFRGQGLKALSLRNAYGTPEGVP